MSFQFKALSATFNQDSAGGALSCDNATHVYIAAKVSDATITNVDTGFEVVVPTGNIIVLEKGKYEKIWSNTSRVAMTKITQPR